MNNFNKGIKLVFSYMKKYYPILLIIFSLIIINTYLQVKTPQILGESIDSMSKYVNISIQEKGTNELLDNLKESKSFSNKQKEYLKKENNWNDKQVEDNFKLMSLTYNLSKINNGFKNKKELDKDQLKFIKDSKNLNEKEKLIFSKMKIKDYKKINKNLEKIKIDKSKKEKKSKNFNNSIFKMLLFILLTSLSIFIYNILMSIVSGKTTENIRNSLFRKLQSLPVKFFDTTKDGELLSRFTNDIDNLSNAMNQSLVQFLSQISLLFGVVWMMFKQDKTSIEIFKTNFNNIFVWEMIIMALFSIFIIYFIIVKAQFYTSKQQEKLGNLNSFIDEKISFQNLIIAYNLKKETITKFKKINNDLKTTIIKGQIFSGLLMPIMQGFSLINIAIIATLGTYIIVNDLNSSITIGVLISFIQYSQIFFQPMAQIMSQFNILQLGFIGSQRVSEIMETKNEMIENPKAKKITKIKNSVVLKNVNFSYEKNKPILKNINIEANKNKTIALVGPTGSGKTSIINLINRYYDIDSGEILIDGKNIKDYDLSSLRKKIGIVLQDSILFSGTIKENISYGKRNATKKEIINAAKQTKIHDFIMSLEKGYDTNINDASSLSAGQKQLICMARTILTNPDILILDEATSNVDTVTEANIKKAMDRIIKNRISFVIAHRLTTILNADTIIVLKDGKIIEKGNHKELIKLNGFYKELYENQFINN